MGHLRRFAKRTILPDHLLQEIEADTSAPANNGQTIFVVIPPPLPDVESLQELLAPFAPLPRRGSSATPPANSPPLSSPTSTSGSPEPQPPKIRILKTQVPIYPPFTAAQGEKWTKTMWPVVFNPAAPRSTIAPPPQVLGRVQESIRPRAGYFLGLARKVAEESKQTGRGRGVGAVIVDPSIEERLENQAWRDDTDSTERWMDAVISVGGDVRYARSEAGASSQTDLHAGDVPNPASTIYEPDLEGGPDLHALMRAVELVARRRREEGDHLAQYDDSVLPVIATDPQLSTKLSPLESHFLYEVCGQSATPEPENSIAPPLSPKKRKHEETNPEIAMASLDVNLTDSVDPLTTLPAPPSSTAAIAIPDSTPVIGYVCSPPDFWGCSSPPETSRIRTRSQGGYLCTGLDIYLSHEPCLCCSMGVLLSRFRAVIFPRTGRMQGGGIASEPVVNPTPGDWNSDSVAEEEQDGETEGREYYGLHWRKELNWRALGFEFVETDGAGEDWEVDVAGEGDGEDLAFHA